MTVGELDIDAFVALVSQTLEPKFEAVDKRFVEAKTDSDAIYKKLETVEQEMLVVGHQLDKHEERIQSLEKKVA